MGDSRTANTKRNLYWGMAAKAVGLLLPFLTRSVMIYTLGMRYVGLDSLFKSLLDVLSFAELGFGGALVFSMYRPMAERDVKRVNALLAFYRKCYRVIGMVILVLGLCMTSFLDIFVNGDVPPEVNLKALFLIQLVNTVTGYFMFAYQSSIFQAQQRVDISQKVTLTLNIISNFARIGILLINSNYYIYILVGPAVTILQNIFVAYLSRKKYPEYYCEGIISQEEKKDIRDKVYGLMFQKVGGIVLFSVDTVVISSFLGLETLGIYNGYYYVITALVGFISVIQAAVIPSLGNSVVLESKEKNYQDFRKFHFLLIWLLTWWSACLLCLFQPFMILWQGKENTLSFGIVALFCFYFYLHHAGDITYMYKEAAGLWWQGRYCALLAAALNLALNLILVQVIGLPGILISTIIALVTVNVPYGAWVLFRYYFESRGKYLAYLRRMGWYLLAAVGIAAVTYGVCLLIPVQKLWPRLICNGAVCTVLPNLLFLGCYWKLDDFQRAFCYLQGLRKKL
ncbi:MAG: oligosaccharide flippase family protein [Lachnospiraceae bacterium]|nr:oligosaccharide flippase family protein [Lachnospiraceae bacterium]